MLTERNQLPILLSVKQYLSKKQPCKTEVRYTHNKS